MLKFFKRKPIQNWTFLFTGILFLNMSFFLAEVSALKLNKNKQLIENIAKLIAGAASEEEKDAFGSEKSDNLNELDLTFDLIFETPFEQPLLSLATFMSLHDSKPEGRGSAPFNPPPEA